ncbi:MAG: D-glycero-alpha-D-manno-heptose-1,7-bisphosphate 7-phosphatase [Candidatus Methylacidiphilales bacterium]|nr:HAD family hydrolase [Candidatus Methylacidiphilales bacterium]
MKTQVRGRDPGAVKAVLLDKDGTLVKDVPYNVDIHKVHFAEGAVDSLLLLQEAGYKLFIISNQSGIALNYFSRSDFHRMRKYISDSLESFGIQLSGFYYCPHHPSGSNPEYAFRCQCRKPEPGMLYQAAAEHGIDLHNSWMVGDILHDVEAGNRAGCRTVLLDVGNETEWVHGPYRTPDFTATSLRETAEIILAATDIKPPPAAMYEAGPATVFANGGPVR